MLSHARRTAFILTCVHPFNLLTQVKNVGCDMLEGKVGRIYMPKQNVEGLALAKPKGLKRERREAAAARFEANHAPADKRQRTAGSDGGDSE